MTVRTFPVSAVAGLALLVPLAGCGSSTPPPHPLGAKPPSVSPSPAQPSSSVTPVPTTDSGNAALAAGRTFAVTFFSPDYRRLDGYLSAVELASTGEFQTDLEAKQDQLRSITSSAQSIATGHVLAAGVRDVTPTTATVLIAADQEVRNASTGSTPVTNRYRIAASMRLVDQRWLVENFEPVADVVVGCTDVKATSPVQDVLGTGCDALAAVYSYDYRRIDADILKQEALTVGPLHDEIKQRVGPALRKEAVDGKFEVTAQPVAGAVERIDGDTATMLVFLNETVASTHDPTPRLDRNRVEATMRRVDGRWQVSDLKPL